MCDCFKPPHFVCFLGNKRARKACGAWTCPSWARMKFFPDNCGRLTQGKCIKMGLFCCGFRKARIWTWGVVDVEGAHPLMHAFVQSTAACTVSVRPGLCRLSGPVFCVRVFLLSSPARRLCSTPLL